MISEDKIKSIQMEYDAGSTYKEISAKYNLSSTFISKIIKGRRTRSESSKLCSVRGRRGITDETRLKLSENAKRNIRCGKKIWTKPEREFVNILRSYGIGVRFPEYMCEIFDLVSDENATIFSQYPIQRYVCDFVNCNSKTIFRINGDFWHANPLLYDPSKLTKIQEFNCGRDKLAKDYFEKEGWTVVDIWESEIYWNKELVKQKVGNIETNGDNTCLDWSNKIKEMWFKKPRAVKIKNKKPCEICGNQFYPDKFWSKYCSIRCCNYSRRKPNRPSLEQLEKDVSKMTMCAVGRKYGVSDNAIRKWIRQYKNNRA